MLPVSKPLQTLTGPAQLDKTVGGMGALASAQATWKAIEGDEPAEELLEEEMAEELLEEVADE